MEKYKFLKKGIYEIYFKKALYIIFFLLPYKFVTASDNKLVTVELKQWSATVNLKNLEVIGIFGKNQIPVTPPSSEAFGDFKNLSKSKNKVTWDFPEKNLSVEVEPENNFLVFKFTSTIPQVLAWPSSLSNLQSPSNQNESLLIPDGEGIIIPTQDLFWKEKIQQFSAGEYSMEEQLSLPFFAKINNFGTVTYLSESSLNNTLRIKTNNNQLYIQQEHQFRKKDHFSPYVLRIAVQTSPDIMAPAQQFREFLQAKNNFLSLKQKTIENANIAKLNGAFHAYIWGDGRSEKALQLLKSIGIKSLWLGYDQNDNDKFKVTKNYIALAKNFGYLIAPYDTWENLQDPQKADTQLAVFPSAWPKAAIVDEKGRRTPGFHNRGYIASSEYFSRQTPENKDLYTRASLFKETGNNSYFLDVDATGTLHDDYSPDHSMNTKKDMENRIKRMRHLSERENFVLGSETAVYWAVPFLAFAHGNFSVFNAPHWKLTRDKTFYGRWYPSERPGVFFKSIQAPEDYVNTRYNPQYRIPLFQMVFHDSVITTDRWEIPITKFTNVKAQRVLFEILYGIPSMWSLDIKTIQKNKLELKKYASFFDEFHKKIAQEPLTNFLYLTEDKTVQQTTFGKDVKVTANFSELKFKNIPPKSLEIFYLNENRRVIYTP